MIYGDKKIDTSGNLKTILINFLAISGPQFLFTPNLIFFLWLKTPCKIWEPYDNSFWEKSNNLGRERERKKEREKTPLVVDTYFHDSRSDQFQFKFSNWGGWVH
jgi:hypothetical protein